MLWKKMSETPLRVGYRRLLTRHFEMPDGRIEEFTIKDEQPAVCILALTADQQVILAKQFRPGPEKILLELPGGGVEEKETPEEAAQRELLEETGYNGTLQYLGMTLDCAYSTVYRHNFVAMNCQKIQEPKPDKNEFIEITLLSLHEFHAHLRSGQLTDMETGYLGLDMLGLLN